MSTTALSRTDHQIQKAVQDELAWAPDVDDAGIGVAVEDGTDISKRIKDALARNAALDARGITVRSSGGVVTLTGTVRSWAELTQVRAAWNSPHVTDVINRLAVKE